MAWSQPRRPDRTGGQTLVAAACGALCWWGLAVGCAAGDATTDDDDGAGATGNAGGGTTTTTSSSSGTGASTTTTTSGTGGAPCAEDPCKLVPPQCGCGFDEKCSVGADGPTCTQDGTIDGGQQCLGSGCKAGFVCTDYVAPPQTCRQFCDDDGDCQPPGGVCVLPLTINGTTPYTVTLCSNDCDPISNAGCPVPGMRCDVLSDDGPPERNFTMCLPAGTQGQGQPCSGLADCAAGLSCFNVNNADICVTWCDRSALQCPTGTGECLETTPPTMVGTTEYGVCFAG